jgi:hypothetical protein
MTDIETLRALVEQGRFGDARALAMERGPALFDDLTREEFIALTDMLAVVDQAAEASEADGGLAASGASGAAPRSSRRGRPPGRGAAPAVTG